MWRISAHRLAASCVSLLYFKDEVICFGLNAVSIIFFLSLSICLSYPLFSVCARVFVCVISLTHVIAQASVIPPIFSITKPHKESIDSISCVFNPLNNSGLQCVQYLTITALLWWREEIKHLNLHFWEKKLFVCLLNTGWLISNLCVCVKEDQLSGGEEKQDNYKSSKRLNAFETWIIYPSCRVSSSSQRSRTLMSHVNKPLSARQQYSLIFLSFLFPLFFPITVVTKTNLEKVTMCVCVCAIMDAMEQKGTFNRDARDISCKPLKHLRLPNEVLAVQRS